MNQYIFACKPKAGCCPLLQFERAQHAPKAACDADFAAKASTTLQSVTAERRAAAPARRLRARAWSFSGLSAGSSLSLLIGLCAIGAPAQAQVHEAQKGGYVVRANVANAQMLPPDALAKHKLRAAALLINVVVLKQGQPIEDSAVAADVVVKATDLLGTTSQIDMREVKEQTGTSYLGTFDFPLNGLELDFHITARPAGSDTEIGLRFRDRLPRPAR